MSTPITVNVFEIVGTPLCVASTDGQKVYEEIKRAFNDGKRVELSFRNVDSLTSAFLNAAIGQLYKEHTPEQIRENLKVVDAEQDDLALLKRVVDTAKEYFKNPRVFKQAGRDVFGEGSG